MTPITDTMPASNSSSNLFMNNENDSNTCSSWLEDQILTEDDDLIDDEDSLLSQPNQF